MTLSGALSETRSSCYAPGYSHAMLLPLLTDVTGLHASWSQSIVHRKSSGTLLGGRAFGDLVYPSIGEHRLDCLYLNSASARRCFICC